MVIDHPLAVQFLLMVELVAANRKVAIFVVGQRYALLRTHFSAIVSLGVGDSIYYYCSAVPAGAFYRTSLRCGLIHDLGARGSQREEPNLSRCRPSQIVDDVRGRRVASSAARNAVVFLAYAYERAGWSDLMVATVANIVDRRRVAQQLMIVVSKHSLLSSYRQFVPHAARIHYSLAILTCLNL